MKICFPGTYNPLDGRGCGGWKWIGHMADFLLLKGHEVTYDLEDDFDLYIGTGAQIEIFDIEDFLLPKKAEGIKILHRIDGIGVSRYSDGEDRICKLQEYADLTIFQSRFAQEKGREVGMKGKQVVIHNGVDPDIWSPDGEKPKGREGRYPVCLYAEWSQKEHKRFGHALGLFNKILKKYPDALLIVCGLFSEKYVSQGFQLPRDSHIYHYRVSAEFLAKEMRGADMLLFPSKNDWCPNLVLEAMSVGLPIIYDPSGGTTELIGDCGIVSTWKGQWKPVEKALQIGKEMGKKSHRRVLENFTLDGMLNAYYQEIESLF